MGCDIHMHTEIKVNGKWEHYSQPNVKRNYRLFSFMADVRNMRPGHPDYIKPVRSKSTFPAHSASVTTRLDYEHWGPDAHSVTVLNKEQIKEVCNYYDTITDDHSYGFEYDTGSYLFGNGWDYEESMIDGVEDYRWICWFDN